jgi:hypothetical protein
MTRGGLHGSPGQNARGSLGPWDVGIRLATKCCGREHATLPQDLAPDRVAS